RAALVDGAVGAGPAQRPWRRVARRTPPCGCARRVPGTATGAALRTSRDSRHAADPPSQVRLIRSGAVGAFRARFFAAQQDPSTSVRVEPYPGQFPAAILRFDGQPRRGAEPGYLGWQTQRRPFVLVRQFGVPARRQPAVPCRRQRGPVVACSMICTPPPAPDTTYNV